jgi:O-antigen/teichoic acid export membrane protein
LTGPALAMAGLPAIRRALEEEGKTPAARALAVRISGTALAVVTVFLLAVGSIPSIVMELVFGREFTPFAHLILPIGVAQLVGGAVLGFNLFLKASSEGRKLVWGQLVYSVGGVALSVALAIPYGVLGAAWGLVLAGVIGAGLIVGLSYRVGVRDSKTSRSLG